MATTQEKSDFSARLWFALRKHSSPIKGATDLARHFNLRHHANADIGVSVQTTHKWLNGRAIPTSDKIKTLAEWLNVTEHWLHYGPPPASAKDTNAKQVNPPSSETLALAKNIEALPEHQRYLVAELVAQFLRKSGV